MANFTINSLNDGIINATDKFIKSDANGALTKITPAQLKQDAIGTANFSAVGADVSTAIFNSNIYTATDSYTSDILPNPAAKRHGNLVQVIIQGATTGEFAANAIATFTVAQKYSSNSVRMNGLAFAWVNSVYLPLSMYIDNTTVTVQNVSGQAIPSGKYMHGVITYCTNVAP